MVCRPRERATYSAWRVSVPLRTVWVVSTVAPWAPWMVLEYPSWTCSVTYPGGSVT
ncbi:hypothetical protein [Ornithinimicrobium kibberense]|uniref:hypothetical protein n=1 Tax=Ornithinimicrobium kibberense TaxID=282060 RepID=UPI003620CF12